MRPKTVAKLALVGVVWLLSLLPRTAETAQTQGMLWINDSFELRGGQGIYQFDSNARLKLLIPNSKVRPFNQTSRRGEALVSDAVADAQGQIFLLDYYGGQILRATLQGELSLAAWFTGIPCPVSMAIDTQGNFIIADNCLYAIFRVQPDGVARLVAPLTFCPEEVGSISIAVENTGDYVVSQHCGFRIVVKQLLRITPSGEAIVTFKDDPLFSATFLVVDPQGRGYYTEGAVGFALISPTGAITQIEINHNFPKKGNNVANWSTLDLGPNGDLLLGTFCVEWPSPRCPPSGVYQISPDGAKVKVLYEGDALALPISLLWLPQ